MHRLFFATALTALASPAQAATRNAAEPSSVPAPAPARAEKQKPSLAQGAVDGFSGNLLVTPDADWQAKWETPPETAPHFNTTSHVGLGGRVWVLPFFTHPGVDAEGNAHVVCDLQMIRPDGSVADHPDQPCLEGPMPKPMLVYLGAAALGFIAEDTDPRGLWRVRITLHDLVRGVSLPLETSFTYE